MTGTGSDAQAVTGTTDRRASAWYCTALPVIEISDKDYRSFSLPCDVLEEAADGNPEH